MLQESTVRPVLPATMAYPECQELAAILELRVNQATMAIREVAVRAVCRVKRAFLDLLVTTG